ncbi:hypothetical protein AGABI2DRAFT_136191 [Agaricus bisporus var. bisporus H97]|uniref:hypothetical protein n=1 Tax=Agaricus bisporus var. bisporus (strain H97 / ATCC MYA-4626 / FGSC 10389) TaxID=936046 RepID=UPI00029F7AE3|nr:hypothetical protein AGABI2DRAFT_136191 [Agaricus bisporus var. bisporus H97]EKV47494.1 hypothetical protein AGABI2DRAFT_136191 [Agaricus bisporus var. bisporus H97]
MANLNRPSPPSLPREQQREFEELIRKAQAPSSGETTQLHPDAPELLKPEFEGNINPKTGEKGGPKREPVGRWSVEGGDWSFKGRVTDF